MTNGRRLLMYAGVVAALSIPGIWLAKTPKKTAEVLLAKSYAERFTPGPNAKERGWEHEYQASVDSVSIPLRLRWTTTTDSVGCERVVKVRLERLGGPANVTIKQVSTRFFVCLERPGQPGTYIPERTNVVVVYTLRTPSREAEGQKYIALRGGEVVD